MKGFTTLELVILVAIIAIFAGVKKYPNETRHETALRYIKQAESDTTENAKQPK